MLTGDHPFTAVSIAHSCGLIDNSYSVIIINTPHKEEINEKLVEVKQLPDNVKLCLVSTGDALTTIMQPENSTLKKLFLETMIKCKAAIGSRVSPKQKADLVHMIKGHDRQKSTLAIGDGANDVNMITAADVGIGIMGNEGQQAARASDYVIGQFSYLRRLTFVHGRESYRKNAYAVGYILWKNFLYVMPPILYFYLLILALVSLRSIQARLYTILY
jgi:phospholipid-transporting ATPase